MNDRHILIDDDYCHPDLNLEYCLENVLYIPEEETPEYLSLKHLFNSILVNNCLCIGLCDDQCSHSRNYKTIYNENNAEELILNNDRLSKDLIYECSMNCKCSFDCGNRLVQKGPRKNLIIMRSTFLSQQKGLFTAVRILKGGFICEYAGEILTRSEALRRDKQLENFRISNVKENTNVQQQEVSNYIICLKENSLHDDALIETFIDPTKCGNIGRYINHSCDANCEIISVRIDCPIPKLGIFAKRNIEALEELYFHYGGEILNNAQSQTPLKKCMCNSKNCQQFLPGIKY